MDGRALDQGQALRDAPCIIFSAVFIALRACCRPQVDFRWLSAVTAQAPNGSMLPLLKLQILAKRHFKKVSAPNSANERTMPTTRETEILGGSSGQSPRT